MRRERIEGIGDVFHFTGEIVEATPLPAREIGGQRQTRIVWEAELDGAVKRWAETVEGEDVRIGGRVDIVVLPSRTLVYASSPEHGVLSAYWPPRGSPKPLRITDPGCGWVLVVFGGLLIAFMAMLTVQGLGKLDEEEGPEVTIIFAFFTAALAFCVFGLVKELRRDPEKELDAQWNKRAAAANAALARLVAQQRGG